MALFLSPPAPAAAAGAAALPASSRRLHQASPSPAFAQRQPSLHLAARPSQRLLRRDGQRQVMAQAAVAAQLGDVQAEPVLSPDGTPASFPNAPGVYAVYDADGTLQYIGISRRVSLSVATHLEELPQLTAAVKVAVVADPSKETLTEAWKEWVQDAVNATGAIPPGNMPGEKMWTTRKSLAKPEIRLTSGKGLADLTCSVEELVDMVVKSNRVVAFVKGTRTQPQCGFSHKVLTILNDSAAAYEVVNVLDEVYNPGLREAIKTYSQWPTIPQVFIDGEFVGGADIVEELHLKGELKALLTQQQAAAKQ